MVGLPDQKVALPRPTSASLFNSLRIHSRSLGLTATGQALLSTVILLPRKFIVARNSGLPSRSTLTPMVRRFLGQRCSRIETRISFKRLSCGTALIPKQF